MWEENPPAPISSTHSIHSESLCVLAVWINPVFSLPAVGGKSRENQAKLCWPGRHLFLLFILTTQVRLLYMRGMHNSFTFMDFQWLYYAINLQCILIQRSQEDILWRLTQGWNAVIYWSLKLYTCWNSGSFQLQMLYNVLMKCALSHFALYHCNTSGHSVWNMKMNLLCRWSSTIPLIPLCFSGPIAHAVKWQTPFVCAC